MNDIKVSVIIPTYKRSEYLIRAINSVLNQTYSNIEIIVVDDNDSKSEYREITEKKMASYNTNAKIIYIKNEKNIGGAKSRNVGIQNATGEYITFLDDDDIYLNEKVERQLESMLDAELDVTFTDLRLHNMKDKLVDYREFKFIKSFENNKLLKYHLTRHITGTPTFMFKSKTLREANGFRDVNMGQEFYLMLDTIESGAKIGYIPESYVVAYLHNGEKISSGPNKINGEKALYFNKQKYFSKLTPKEIKYIKFRHRAVMAVAYKRNKQYGKLLFEGVKAVGLTPLVALKEILLFVKKVINNK